MRQKNQQTIEMLETHAREIRTLRQSLNAARNDSCTDALTGLANRRQFEMFLAEAIAEATAHDAPLSLLLIDVDHFKSFNDRYGHLTGDQVLRLVAACAGQHIKGQDLAARYGGEEFAVVLPKATAAGARSVAEAIRKSIVSKPLKKKSSGEPLGQVTVSVGIASLRPGDKREQVIERADECLYAAKAAGRNCVVVEDQMPAGGSKDRPAGAVTLEGNTRRAPAIATA
jgi:diguanylate cyclase